MDRSVYPANVQIPTRPGAWYEWISIDIGGVLRWVPVGGSGTSAAPPLHFARPGVTTGDPVNQWLLGSDHPTFELPLQLEHGDCIAIFADAACQVRPALSTFLQKPDLSAVVAWPTYITLAAGTYYEWIYTEADNTWHPRQNMLDGVTFTNVKTALGIASSSVAFNAQRITGVADPTGAQDVATKNYVDASAWKQPVRAVAVSNITLSGTQTIDGIALIANDRCLAAGQTTSANIGIYVVSASAWIRSTDADVTGKLKAGAQVYVNEGTIYKDTVWGLATNDPITVGTTALVWTQLGGQKASAIPPALNAVTSAQIGTSPRWALEDHGHTVYSLNQGQNGFRISNDTANSLSVDNLISGTVYMVSHTGNRISLYDGTRFVFCEPASQLSIAVTGQSAGVPCDVFCVYATATSATLELTPWSNATTRATGLTQLQGVWTKSAAPTRRYLGTILPASATQYAHIAAPAGSGTSTCGIWNQDNQVLGMFNWKSNTDAWPLSTANAWTQLNGQAAAKITYVHGQPINVSVEHAANVAVTAATTEAY